MGRRKGRHCCIIGCNSDEKVKMFQFPRADTPLYQLWKQACHASLSHILPLKTPLVCALHFHPDCFGALRLTTLSVPSLRLEVPPTLKTSLNSMLNVIEHKRKISYINAVVYEWILRAGREPDIRKHITQNVIKAMANKANEIIGLAEFVADERWWKFFQETFNIQNMPPVSDLKPMNANLSISAIVIDLQHRFPPLNVGSTKKVTNQHHAAYAEVSSPSFKQIESRKLCETNYTSSVSSLLESNPINPLRVKLRVEKDGDIEFVNAACQNKLLANAEANYTLNSASRDNTCGDLKTYEEALEYLRPLQDFVRTKDNLNVIELMSQLECILQSRIQVEKCTDSRV